MQREVPALTAINMRLRDDYINDAAGGVGRWNKIIEKAGVQFELKLPHESFHRQIGVFSAARFSPDGSMKPVYEPGKFAGWIAPPKVGIDNKPGDFEYVKLHMA